MYIYWGQNTTETESDLILSIEKFIKIDNKEKFKNIFDHSCKMISNFIENNKI